MSSQKATPSKKEVARSFTKFLFVGGSTYVLGIAINWLLIDILGIATWLGSAIMFILMLLTKFVAYLVLGVIRKQFVKYVAANIAVSALGVLLVTLLVDLAGLTVPIGTAIVLAFIFVFRYVVFHWVGLLKWSEKAG